MANWIYREKGQDFPQDIKERLRGKILTNPSGHHIGVKLMCCEERQLDFSVI